jgi:SCP-2 sterol transfer family protein
VATKREVEAKLQELIGRLDAADDGVDALAQALPESRVIEVVVSDLGDSYWTELAGGRMGTLRKGRPDEADIRITADSDELVEVVDGKRSLFSSYLSGDMKVEASFADIMRLRRLV